MKNYFSYFFFFSIFFSSWLWIAYANQIWKSVIQKLIYWTQISTVIYILPRSGVWLSFGLVYYCFLTIKGKNIMLVLCISINDWKYKTPTAFWEHWLIQQSLSTRWGKSERKINNDSKCSPGQPSIICATVSYQCHHSSAVLTHHSCPEICKWEAA